MGTACRCIPARPDIIANADISRMVRKQRSKWTGALIREDCMNALPQIVFTRRSVLRGAAGASLTAAAALPPLALLAGAATASTYRGIVGDLKPRATDSSLVLTST